MAVTTGRGGAPFVGREAELAELERGLGEAHGGLYLIAGEPGIGKTRLADAFAQTAEARGGAAVWGRAWEGGGAPAFWPWVQVVRALARRFPDIDPGEAGDLGEIAAGPGADGERARFALFDALATYVRAVASTTPLVIVLDDLQAADEASLRALQFLARGLHEAPLVVVATTHEAAAQRRPELGELFGELARSGRRITLRGLAPSELALMLEHRSGGPPSPSLVDKLHAATEGNPFYIDEMVRLLAAEGRLDAPVEGMPLPDGVRDAIARRLAPLPQETRDVLDLAAMIGREFRISTLARAGAGDREHVVEALSPAIALGIVDAVPGTAGSLRFSHGLIPETTRATLPPGARARLHARVADALAEAYADDLEPHLFAVAHHYLEAAALGDAGKALDYARRAGEHAMQVLAFEQAAGLFEGALAALDLLDPDPRARAELLLDLGRARMHAGDERARETLFAAAEAAARIRAPELRAQAAMEAGGFGLYPGIVDDALVQLLEDALAALPEEDSELRVHLLVRLAVALYWTDEADRRAALVDDAVAMARRLGNPATIVVAIENGQLATASPETVERGLAWAEEVARIAEQDSSVDDLLAHSWALDLLLEVDDLPAADIALEAFERRAEARREPRAQANVLVARARRASLEGRFAEAEELCRRAATAGASLRFSTAPLLAVAQLVAMRWTQYRLGELEDRVREGADGLVRMPVWRCALVALLCQSGREAEAARELDRLAADDFASLPRDNVLMLALALLSDACAHLRDGKRAAALQPILAPYAARNVVSPLATFAGPVTRYLGLLASARDDWEAASGHFVDARRRGERLGARPLMALVRVDEAEMLRRRGAAGDSTRAATLLTEARAIATELDMARVVERIDSLGVSSAAATAGSAETALAATLRREGDVWTLAHGQRVVRVKDGKGVRHLATLLERPGVEFHAADLVAGAGSRGRRAAADPDLEVRAGGGDAGPALDAQAKAQYRERLEELREDIEEAEAFQDPERAARAREEMQFIAQELASAVGLGGRDRKISSDAERARVNVTRAVRSTIKRIAEHDESLGHELDATIKTGTFCSYEPDPRGPVIWTVER